jgi:hypothetical protein
MSIQLDFVAFKFLFALIFLSCQLASGTATLLALCFFAIYINLASLCRGQTVSI